MPIVHAAIPSRASSISLQPFPYGQLPSSETALRLFLPAEFALNGMAAFKMGVSLSGPAPSNLDTERDSMCFHLRPRTAVTRTQPVIRNLSPRMIRGDKVALTDS